MGTRSSYPLDIEHYRKPNDWSRLLTNDGRAFINMRVFSAATSEAEAADVVRKIGDRMREFGKPAVSGMKRYWKIPEYYEFSMALSSRQLSRENVQEIIEQLGSDWQEVASNCFVWNGSTENKSVDVAPKFYPVLSSLQRFLVAVFGAVAAGCGAEPFWLRSSA